MLDSSPFQSSPFNASDAASSPRLLWKSREERDSAKNTPSRLNAENLFASRGDTASPGPHPTRRSSIERLQKASRVKNSSMFAREQKQEYDPTHIPIVERPLAKHVQGNAFDGMGIAGLRNEERRGSPRPWLAGHGRSKSEIVSSYTLPRPQKDTAGGVASNIFGSFNNNSTSTINNTSAQASPMAKPLGSPTKSSLSSTPKFNGKSLYNPESNTWDSDISDVELDQPGRIGHRHTKSVTFDARPPMINEYEMVTPAPSSIASDNEYSYDEEETDDEDIYHHSKSHDEEDDSFDASLEDLSKTPVVGPDDWRRTSLDEHRYSGEYEPESPEDEPRTLQTGSLSPNLARTGDRPLPPLPGMRGSPSQENRHSFAAQERAHSQSPRPTMQNSYSNNSFTKSDLQGLSGSRMPLEERLRLMMMSDEQHENSEQKTPAELQRERRMRRSNNRTDRFSNASDLSDGDIKIHEDEDTLADLGDYQLPPRISRESILRKVNGDVGNGLDSSYTFSSPMPSSSPERPAALMLDPDVPIPSTEKDEDDGMFSADEGSVIVKPEHDDEIDISSITQMYDARGQSRATDADNDSMFRTALDDDDQSMYSDNFDDGTPTKEVLSPKETDSGPSTPRAVSPKADNSAEPAPITLSPEAKEEITHEQSELVSPAVSPKRETSTLPDFANFQSTESLHSHKQYTPSPPPVPAKDEKFSKSPESDGIFQQKFDKTVQQSFEDAEPVKQATPVPEERALSPRLWEEAPKLKKSPFFTHELPAPNYDGTGWGSDPEDEYKHDQEDECPGTPDSVIHHSVVYESDHSGEQTERDSYDKPREGEQYDPNDEEQSQYSVASMSSLHDLYTRQDMTPPPPSASPAIPEQLATIKSAAGSKLKTRPSITPSDAATMREMRRHISTEYPVPPIPRSHMDHTDFAGSSEEEVEADNGFLNVRRSMDEPKMRKASFKKLDIGGDLDFGLGLDKEFDHIIEQEKVNFDLSLSRSLYRLAAEQGEKEKQEFAATMANTTANSGLSRGGIRKQRTLSRSEKLGQVSRSRSQTMTLGPETSREKFLFGSLNANVSSRKQRGYLMRQNTKVVVATSDADRMKSYREARSEGNSPVKQGPPRPQSWTVEPWNGSPRKRSDRHSMTSRKRMSGSVPPLPGQKSNVDNAHLGAVAEDLEQPEADFEGERGRLFVKVIGVKDLDLPLPRNERTWFALTLDNGVHCVTTAWLELGRNAPIGQEFELVVPSDLEFQLTLNAKLTRPPPRKEPAPSVTRTPKPKQSTLSRVFASPRKRKELEAKMKAEEEETSRKAQQELAAKRASQMPTAWDLLSPLAGDDGAFGRSYVCLKDHEQRCYGRPYIVDVTCFNEWATADDGGLSSVKSKTGSIERRRRAPYKVGKLELQLLFVPKPRGAKEEDMPKSMNSCIRAMKEAEETRGRSFEGFLSQQGGDCPVSKSFWVMRCMDKKTNV